MHDEDWVEIRAPPLDPDHASFVIIKHLDGHREILDLPTNLTSKESDA